MASTNKTTNYNLSQFIGTDKPAWLSDYNQDMTKIDTGIKNAADTATGADGKADANTTSIGTLSNLTTTNKTDLVAAINEVDSNADTAQGSADAVGIVAQTNATDIAAINRYFAFTQFGTCPVTATGASKLSSDDDLRYASNADGTLGKIYGRIVLSTTSSTYTYSFPTPFRPDSAIDIDGVALAFDATNNLQTVQKLSLATNGTMTCTISGTASGRTIRILFPACTLFIEDFGD